MDAVISTPFAVIFTPTPGRPGPQAGVFDAVDRMRMTPHGPADQDVRRVPRSP